MSHTGKIITGDSVTVANAYQFWLPCQQIAPDITVVDFSGNNADAVLGGDHAAADLWTNAGWATTVEGAADDTFKVPVANIAWDYFKGESFILSFWTNSVNKTGTSGILGTGGAVGEPGPRILIDTNGKLKSFTVFDDVGFASDGNAYGADLSAAIHHNVVAVDAVAGTFILWQDGVNLQSGTDIDTGLQATGGVTTQPDNDFFFGSDAEINDTVGAQFKDIHFLVWTGGMPSNIGSIVNLLYTRPFYPLSQKEFPL